MRVSSYRCFRSPPGRFVQEGSTFCVYRGAYLNFTSVKCHEEDVEKVLAEPERFLERSELPRRRIAWVQDGEFWVDYVTDLLFVGDS